MSVFEVRQQGAPILNDLYVVKETEDVFIFSIDLKSKYCEVDGTIEDSDDVPGVSISATEESYGLANVDRDLSTEVYFPNHVGWRVWSCSMSKYALNGCLIKKEK